MLERYGTKSDAKFLTRVCDFVVKGDVNIVGTTLEGAGL
jgi:hypothetical protein